LSEVSEEAEESKEEIQERVSEEDSSSHSVDETELQERPSSQYVSDHHDSTIDQTLMIETLSNQGSNSFSDRNRPFHHPPSDSVTSLKDLSPLVTQSLTPLQGPRLLAKRARSMSRGTRRSALVHVGDPKKIIKEFCEEGSFELTHVEDHLLPRLQAQIGIRSTFEVEELTGGRAKITCSAGDCPF
jgi:hypothetical protein